MKKIHVILFVLFILSFPMKAISPYLLLAESTESREQILEQVRNLLLDKDYQVLGEYSPAADPKLYVLAFTHASLQDMARKAGKQEMLAAVMKIGLQEKAGRIHISMVNPEYLFHAYFREAMNKSPLKEDASRMASKVLNDLDAITSTRKAFGGDVEKEDLQKYRYMVGMPRFDDPVELAEFASFEQGISRIRKNLAGSASMTGVYEWIDPKSKVAIFGVGLLDEEIGEEHFLSIIGKDHVAAMPWEIVVVGDEAIMLHGRFRFALHWPELTMGTFTKIMSSPGDVEDALTSLAQ